MRSELRPCAGTLALALICAAASSARAEAPGDAPPEPVIVIPVAPLAGAAAPAPPVAPPSLDGEAPVQLVVNSVRGEVVIVRFDGSGDVWVPVAALLGAGLKGVGGERRTAGGAEQVSLRSLAPGLRFEVDESILELRLHARPELLGRTAIDDAARGRPSGLQSDGHASAFANYAVQGDDERRISAFAELGAGAGRLLATTGLSRPVTGQVVRGLSAVTLEEPERLRRWVTGDAVVGGGPLGGTVVVGGAGVERDFTLDPWFVRQALPRTSAVALTPSTLEVYVNGRLVRRDTVAPGTVDLSNLPVEAGAGQVRTVLRDAYGRSQDVTAAYYFSAGLLAPGVSDYALHAGLRRDAIGTSSASYADAVALGRWRAGVSDVLTIGGRAEGGRNLANGGLTLTAALRLGELELALAGSGGGHASGAAGFGAWTYASRRASAGVRLQGMSREYAHASLAATQDRALLQASAFASAPVLDTASLGIEGSAARMRDALDTVSAALRGTLSLGGGASVSATAGWAREASGRAGPTANVLLTHVFGRQTVASAQADRGADARARGSVGVQRALPIGAGWGYRLDASSGDASSTSGVVQAQGDHGRVEAGWQRAGGGSSGYASGSGGIVLMDGDLFLTRAVQDGFALVQVPGVEGVRGYLNSSEVGRTNARGNLLVPSLLPHHANRLSIRPSDVPIEYELDAVERLVAPPRRIGARVRFDARPVQTVTGTVSVEEAKGRVTPSYGELRVGDRSSPLGSDGRFYLSSLAAGRHDAEVAYAGGVCRFALDVPPIAGSVTDVGAVRCVAGATGSPSVSTVTQTTLASGEGGNETRTGTAAP